MIIDLQQVVSRRQHVCKKRTTVSFLTEVITENVAASEILSAILLQAYDERACVMRVTGLTRVPGEHRGVGELLPGGDAGRHHRQHTQDEARHGGLQIWREDHFIL